MTKVTISTVPLMFFCFFQNVVKPKPPAIPPPSSELQEMNSRLSADPFEGLSDELILRVFSYLVCDARSLCRCAAVSRRFRDVAWRPQLWRALSLADPSLTDARLVALLSLICRQVVSSNLTTVHRQAQWK